MEKTIKYYHITKKSIKTRRSILEKGLLCNEFGEIFLFENKSIGFEQQGFKPIRNYVADIIAATQIFVKEYDMFEIDLKGIVSELVPDNVAEIPSSFQWIVKQNKIQPEYIQLYAVCKTKFKPFIQPIY